MTTDNRPRIPIPNDIRRGDVLVLRDGQRRKWERWDADGDSVCEGISPGGHCRNGSWWDPDIRPEWDVVAIEPKPKPPRDDKDAVWLCSRLAYDIGCDGDGGNYIKIRTDASVESYNKRLRAIARRLNGGKAVARA